MSRKKEKVYPTLYLYIYTQLYIYIEHFRTLVSAITGCISIFAFASLLCIPIEITSFPIGLNICAITAGIKNYKSIIKEKKKKHDKIVFLEKSKLNSIEFHLFKY